MNCAEINSFANSHNYKEIIRAPFTFPHFNKKKSNSNSKQCKNVLKFEFKLKTKNHEQTERLEKKHACNTYSIMKKAPVNLVRQENYTKNKHEKGTHCYMGTQNSSCVDCCLSIFCLLNAVCVCLPRWAIFRCVIAERRGTYQVAVPLNTDSFHVARDRSVDCNRCRHCRSCCRGARTYRWCYATAFTSNAPNDNNNWRHTQSYDITHLKKSTK